jgi:hypothetical protein
MYIRGRNRRTKDAPKANITSAAYLEPNRNICKTPIGTIRIACFLSQERLEKAQRGKELDRTIEALETKTSTINKGGKPPQSKNIPFSHWLTAKLKNPSKP